MSASVLLRHSEKMAVIRRKYILFLATKLNAFLREPDSNQTEQKNRKFVNTAMKLTCWWFWSPFSPFKEKDTRKKNKMEATTSNTNSHTSWIHRLSQSILFCLLHLKTLEKVLCCNYNIRTTFSTTRT